MNFITFFRITSTFTYLIIVHIAMHLEVQSANTVGEVSTNEVTSPLKLFRRNTPLPPLLPLPCMPQTYIGDSGPLSDSSESSPPQKPVVKRKRCETEEDYADEQQENKRPNSRNSSSSRASVSPNHSGMFKTVLLGNTFLNFYYLVK